uniref:C-type lectin n=1 Tax=Panagrellus redivivus TaxID=6233 RepID=A0A7E4W932_PANRE
MKPQLPIVVLLFFKFIQIRCIVCPTGWTYFDDRCWFKSAHNLTWSDASAECHDRYGAALATVKSERDSAFIGRLKTAVESGLRFFDQADPHFMECFSKIPNSALLGSSVMSPSNVKTAEQCVEECANSADRYDQACVSALWYRESKECVLNDKTRNDTDAVFIQDPEVSANIDYYEKICDVYTEDESATETPNETSGREIGSGIPRRKGEMTGVRTCFNKFKHSSLVGFVDRIHDNVTERECLSKCWRCSDCLGKEGEQCKSVTYYPEVKQCILAAASRRNNPEFFDNAEPAAVFFDRRRECLFEMCEDQEIDLVFAIDGSACMNHWGFNRSLELIDAIVTSIHETTEFWRVTVVQVGTEGPAVVEINRISFDTLDDFRRSLATIGWRRSPGHRLGDSLVDVADLAMRYAMSGETDFVWMLTLTNGFSDDKLEDFELLKRQNKFTSFALGVGSELEFVNLQKIATSAEHLIHAQELKKVVNDVSSKLCQRVTPALPPAATPTPTLGSDSETESSEGNETPKLRNSDNEFVSARDAIKPGKWVIHDETFMAEAASHGIASGIKTKIVPSTIAFMSMDGSRSSVPSKFDKKKKDFDNSRRKDLFISVLDEEEDDDEPSETAWIGLRRGELGELEWSDGSSMDEYEANLAKHLDVGLDIGDCVQWDSVKGWLLADCTSRMQFVCNFKPTQTLNEKLSHDFDHVLPFATNHLTSFETDFLDTLEIPNVNQNSPSAEVETDESSSNEEPEPFDGITNTLENMSPIFKENKKDSSHLIGRTPANIDFNDLKLDEVFAPLG